VQNKVNRSILDDSESDGEKSDTGGQSQVDDAAVDSTEIPAASSPGEWQWPVINENSVS